VKNLYAYTPPIAPNPPYISVNEITAAGLVVVTVRSANGGPTSAITLTVEQACQMAHAILGNAGREDHEPVRAPECRGGCTLSAEPAARWPFAPAAFAKQREQAAPGEYGYVSGLSLPPSMTS